MPLEAPVTMATLEFLEDASFVGIEEEWDCMVVNVQLLLFRRCEFGTASFRR
jgi:hypothetical protein